MLASLRPVSSLLAGTVLLLLGMGLLTTLIALQGQVLGFSVTMIGALTAMYYAGYLVGTFSFPALIHRIGHIRAFAFCTALVAGLVLVQTLTVNYWVWLALRLFQGMALVGLYAIIESWLNAAAGPAQRNSLFSVYMMLNLGALAAGQQLLRIESNGSLLFTIVAILVCLAILPVAATHQAQPTVEQSAPRVHLVYLYRRIPTAIVSALLSGLVMGALWGLLPIYAHEIGMSSNHIGTYMSMAIAGGALLQWPLGRFSDKVGRRPSLIGIGAAGTVVAVINLFLPPEHLLATMALIFVLGGLSFAMYPIAVAHVVDYLPQEDLLAGSSGVLLVYGVGSALGPFAAGALMSQFEPRALFAWFAVLNALIAAYAWFRYLVRWRKPAEDHFVPMLRTTPAAMELHPEAEPEPEVEPGTESGGEPSADPDTGSPEAPDT